MKPYWPFWVSVAGCVLVVVYVFYKAVEAGLL